MEENDPKQKESDKDKSNSKIDKIILGAIIGTAVGSVVGMSLAPKDGKENRQSVKKKGSIVSRFVKRVLYGKD